MKIAPIKFYNINTTYTSKKQIRAFPAPICDAVCFKSHNFLDLPKEEVYKRIQASLTPENFIGQGTEAEVYKIKDTDFCVKIPYEALSSYSKYGDKEIKRLFFNKNIEPADAVNHIKIKLSFCGTVMDYFYGLIPKNYIGNKEGRYKLQAGISEMPVRSYKELLYQISNGIDNEMLFDCTPGNLIVNLDKKKLTAIDFIPIKETPREVRPLYEIYSVLTAYGAELETGKKIFEKVINTGLDEFVPKKTPCMDVELFDFVDLCKKRIQETGTKNTNILMQKITQQINLIKKIKKNEYQNAPISGIIEDKIVEIKNIIKYIR